ncbi:MAG: hypothetical protein JSU86_20380 [Phycisphaerales bacterium]|nr:MAG: hypothetical protein JSU86_20380 [Phycisphaerales bacterium]
MKKFHFLAAAVIAASTMCCSATLAQSSTGPQPRLRVMGLLSESSTTPGTYAFASLDKVALGLEGNPVRTKLPLLTPDGHPEPLEVREEAVKIEVLQRSPNRNKYNVLLGPKLCTGTSGPVLCPEGKAGSGWVGRYEGSLKRFKGATVFHLEQGWAFVWSNPEGTAAESDWIIGATDGSEMVLEIVDNTKQRVYFLKGSKITVGCLLDSTKAPSCSTQGKYMEVTTDGESCNFSSWLDIAGSSVEGFVDEAEKMATTAGK